VSAGLNLRLAYEHATRAVLAEAQLATARFWGTGADAWLSMQTQRLAYAAVASCCRSHGRRPLLSQQTLYRLTWANAG